VREEKTMKLRSILKRVARAAPVMIAAVRQVKQALEKPAAEA
jgi:hypothetical protein